MDYRYWYSNKHTYDTHERSTVYDFYRSIKSHTTTLVTFDFYHVVFKLPGILLPGTTTGCNCRTDMYIEYQVPHFYVERTCSVFFIGCVVLVPGFLLPAGKMRYFARASRKLYVAPTSCTTGIQHPTWYGKYL